MYRSQKGLEVWVQKMLKDLNPLNGTSYILRNITEIEIEFNDEEDKRDKTIY